MKRSVLLILLIFAFAACAGQNEIKSLDVASPRPLIYGKWEDTPKNGPGVNLTFQDNNLIKSDFHALNDQIFTEYYFYQILPDDSATFFYTRNVLEQSISVKVEFIDENKIKLECFHTNSPGSNGILDPPMLCFYRDFIRIKE